MKLTNKIEVLNMDCMDYMKDIEDNYFDLAIVDPPYGIGEDGLKNHSRGCMAEATKYIPKQWDIEKPEKEYFNQLFRVSKNQIIWGGNYFIENLKNTSCFIVWDKDNGKTDFADSELAWTSFKSAVRNFKFKWQGMLQENMKEKEKRIHPTQKPIKLYEWLLDNYAKPVYKIIDTHLGSGSSAIAAHYYGCKFVGIELDSDYYNSMIKRFEENTKQMKLF